MISVIATRTLTASFVSYGITAILANSLNFTENMTWLTFAFTVTLVGGLAVWHLVDPPVGGKAD